VLTTTSRHDRPIDQESNTIMDKPLLNRELSPMIAHGLVQASHALRNHYRRFSIGYLVLLFLALVAYLATMPVGSGDTDLWYHMNGGRLLAETGSLPDRAFYSYVDPERSWINYFWGFQVLSYQVHDLFGYEGLIGLRVILVTLSFAAIAGILLDRHDDALQRALGILVLALVVFILVGRAEQVRPHLVSYAMIPTFIYVLGYRRKWLPLLPPLTVIWINLHGTEWPVGAAVCGAYFLEALWSRYRGRAAADAGRVMLWSALCLPAMMLNPFTYRIVLAPFSFPDDIYSYIAELQTYPVETLLTVQLTGPVMPLFSAIALLGWLAIGGWLRLFLADTRPLAALIMSAAGVALMVRGNRFIWEWLLLTLPLWRVTIDTLRTQVAATTPRWTGISQVLLLMILAAPLTHWAGSLDGRHQWPVNTENLPVGVTRFLQEQDVSGRLMAPPNYGGYLAWKLYPDILISGDMQIPPTETWDHFMVFAARRNADALARVLEQYRPEFIGVEVGRESAGDLLKAHEQYVPVYFDDLLVLYVDSSRFAELGEKHRLRHVNPFNLLDDKLGSVEQRLDELTRILSYQPDGRRVQHGITKMLFDNRRFTDALPHAEHFAESLPQNANGHYLLGSILLQLDRCAEADSHYARALAVAPEDFSAEIQRKQGECAYQQKNFRLAFKAFEQALNPYQRVEDPEYLYQFALSAVAVGKPDKARMLLRQLLLEASDEQKPIADRAQALLDDL
jgi:Tfp pilus assembly protein PilF